MQMLDGHHFARKEDGAELVGRLVGERVHRRQEAQRTDCPNHDGRLPVAEEIHQLGRVGEIRRRNDFNRRAGEQSAVNILDRNVKVERRLVGKHVCLTDGEGFRKAGDEVADVAMADDDAFGRAGRAAGKVDIQRVGVDHACANPRKRGFIRGSCLQIFDEQNACGCFKRLQLGKMRPVCYDNRRIQRFQHRTDACGGMAQVEQRIGTARIDRAHEADGGIDALVHVKADDASGRHIAAQRTGDRFRTGNECAERDGRVFVRKGGLFRQTRRRRFHIV